MAGGEVARREVAEPAERFKRVRDAHQTEMAEDYVELIADLIDEKGEARLVDLAGSLGVTKPTVNGAIQRLQHHGLVSSEPSRSPSPRRGAGSPRARATASCATSS